MADSPVQPAPSPVLPPEAAEAADPSTPPARLSALATMLACEPLVAANPATPAATLEALRTARNPVVRAAVAGNPNTPLGVLRKLVAEFPVQFLHNPALPFLLLEHPNLGADFTLAEVAGLMRCADVPRVLLRPLLGNRDPGIRELVPLHVALAEETHTSADMAIAAFVHVAAGLAGADEPALYMLPGLFQPWFLELLSELLDAGQYRRGVGILLARFMPSTIVTHTSHEEMVWCPDATPALLARLALNPRGGVRMRVAGHPNTPLAVLDRLAGDHESEVRLAIARNPRVLVHTLAHLTTDPDHRVRRAVVQHPRLPRKLLWRLAVSDDPAIKAGVGAHAHTGDATLWMLADDWDSGVRGAVARNPTAPAHVLRHLLSDDDPGVRARLAQNPRVPPEVLAQLARDDDADVLDAVARHPRLAPADRARLAGDPARHAALAANPRLPKRQIASLARTDQVEVPRVLASHARTPATLLAQWGASTDLKLRIAVAGNPHTPAATLDQLARDINHEIRLKLEGNPSTPLTVITRLCRTASARQLVVIARHPAVTPARRATIYRRWFERQLRLRAGPSLYRLVYLAMPSLPPKTYPQASASNYWIERYVLARNPDAPPEVQALLAHDGVIHVRAAARDTLAARHLPDDS